jgi:2-iminobutanoate/2-iminopropanoate deaminase
MKRVHYDGAWQQPRGYSPMVATEGGRILWLSGHIGALPETEGRGFARDFDTQVHQTFSNIEQTLARAGARLEDIVTMTAFIADARFSERFIAIRKDYFPSGKYPCSALIVAAGFAKPGLLVEIQAVAVIERAG